jgi:hypothetical protein
LNSRQRITDLRVCFPCSSVTTWPMLCVVFEMFSRLVIMFPSLSIHSNRLLLHLWHESPAGWETRGWLVLRKGCVGYSRHQAQGKAYFQQHQKLEWRLLYLHLITLLYSWSTEAELLEYCSTSYYKFSIVERQRLELASIFVLYCI